LLEDALAERNGKDRPWNAAAAHLVIMVISLAFDHQRDSLDETTGGDHTDRISAMWHGTGSSLPVCL
jgi:hypothetical protein